MHFDCSILEIEMPLHKLLWAETWVGILCNHQMFRNCEYDERFSSWQLDLVKTCLANISTRCSSPALWGNRRRTRASSWNIGKSSCQEENFSSFHFYRSNWEISTCFNKSVAVSYLVNVLLLNPGSIHQRESPSTVLNSVYKFLVHSKHSCQPSRFWRDSPDILTSLPTSPVCS